MYEHQSEYYNAISKSTENADSTVFIEFMLKIILEVLASISTPGDTPEVTPEVRKMLEILTGIMPRKEIMQALGLRDEKHFREHYLRKAIDDELIEMTIPEKPNSKSQKYRLSDKGLDFVKSLSFK